MRLLTRWHWTTMESWSLVVITDHYSSGIMSQDIASKNQTPLCSQVRGISHEGSFLVITSLQVRLMPRQEYMQHPLIYQEGKNIADYCQFKRLISNIVVYWPAKLINRLKSGRKIARQQNHLILSIWQIGQKIGWHSSAIRRSCNLWYVDKASAGIPLIALLVPKWENKGNREMFSIVWDTVCGLHGSLFVISFAGKSLVR